MGNNLHMVLIAALFCCPTAVVASDALPPLPQETYRALSTFEKRIMAAQEQAVKNQAALQESIQEPTLKTIPARRRRHSAPALAPAPVLPLVTPPAPVLAPLPPKRGKAR